MIGTILEIINKVLGLTGALFKLFKKTPSEKEDDIRERLRKELDDIKKGERPRW